MGDRTDTSAGPAQLFLLGAVLPVTVAWLGLLAGIVLATALVFEGINRHRVREHLRSVDTYLPGPTAWQRSAALVSYPQEWARAASSRRVG